MSRILVTGGAGFIGSHLIDALIERGHEVTCLDDFSAGSRDNLAHQPAVELVEGDANQRATYDRLPHDHYDAVFHYAATCGVERTEQHPDRVLEDALSIAHIAELARAGRFGKILYASSSEVYGSSPHLPESEDSPTLGQTPYALVKRYSELTLQALWQQHKIPTVALRFFNVYGPRQVSTQEDAFVVAKFIRLVQDGVAPTLMDGGTQTRDLVFVHDNVKVALAALERSEANGQIINVGTGREVSIAELAREVISLLGKEGEVIPKDIPGRSRDISRRRAATETLQRLLGVTCDTTIHEGLQQTLTH